MTNKEIARLVEAVLEKAWTHTFGVSTSPRLSGAKADLLSSAASLLRTELAKASSASGVERELSKARGRIDLDASNRGECGVIGYPQGEKKICRRAAHHERDGVEYHKDGAFSWLGYHQPGVVEQGDSSFQATDDVYDSQREQARQQAEEWAHGVLRCRVCGAVRDPLDGCPNGHSSEPPQSTDAVARPASSQAGPSIRDDLKGTDKADENHLLFHAEDQDRRGPCGA